MKSEDRNYDLKFIILILIIFSAQKYLAQSTNEVNRNPTESDTTEVEYYPSASEVLLNSTPQDAYVFYKDSLIGSTPMFVESKFDNLILKKVGFDDLSISFGDISPGKSFALTFNGQLSEKSFFEKDIFKILTAGIVVFGGTTAYFKLKADNKFEEYEFSGDKKLLNETRKYDLISGITFTALQINFGLLLYYFLIE